MIGGDAIGADNVIAFNTSYGVSVDSGNQNGIFGNSIDLNKLGQIKLGFSANGGIKPPILDGVFRGSTVVRGRFQGQPNTTYRVDAIVTISPPGAPPEATSTKKFGTIEVTTDANGNASYNHTFPNTFPGFASVRTRIHLQNNSSEDSASKPILDGSVSDMKADITIPDPINQGKETTATLTISNESLSPATKVVVTCGLPPGFQIVGNTNGLVLSNGVLRAELGTMAGGATRTFQVRFVPVTSGILFPPSE